MHLRLSRFHPPAAAGRPIASCWWTRSAMRAVPVSTELAADHRRLCRRQECRGRGHKGRRPGHPDRARNPHAKNAGGRTAECRAGPAPLSWPRPGRNAGPLPAQPGRRRVLFRRQRGADARGFRATEKYRIDVLLFGDCDVQMEADFLRREAAARGIDLRIAASFPDDLRLAGEHSHDAILIGALRERFAISRSDGPSPARLSSPRPGGSWMACAARPPSPS